MVRVDYIISVLKTIVQRFKKPQIILYGDFNLRRDQFLEKVERKINDNFMAHYDKGIFNVTRDLEVQKEEELNIHIWTILLLLILQMLILK